VSEIFSEDFKALVKMKPLDANSFLKSNEMCFMRDGEIVCRDDSDLMKVLNLEISDSQRAFSSCVVDIINYLLCHNEIVGSF